jgi:ABC-type polar amino acid transport system ATPase subunit
LHHTNRIHHYYECGIGKSHLGDIIRSLGRGITNFEQTVFGVLHCEITCTGKIHDSIHALKRDKSHGTLNKYSIVFQNYNLFHNIFTTAISPHT